jgi:hypothetical protein
MSSTNASANNRPSGGGCPSGEVKDEGVKRGGSRRYTLNKITFGTFRYRDYY